LSSFFFARAFEEQAEGWRKRNVFERQWIQRDFKKYTARAHIQLASAATMYLFFKDIKSPEEKTKGTS
jgi:hypothetical protein